MLVINVSIPNLKVARQLRAFT